jgi:intracellular multiplication protein IcmK
MANFLKSTIRFLILYGLLPCAIGQTNVNQQAFDDFQKWLQENGYGQARNTPLFRGKPTIDNVTLIKEQDAILQAAPPSIRVETEESKVAFNALLHQNIPLTPRQVIKLHQEVDVAQRAAAMPPTIPPKPVSTTLMVNLAPGTTPPAVRLAQGYVSTLLFVDSTGAPWPIAAFDIGNPKSVHIQWDGKTNVLFIQAVAPYSYGDIVVRLVGLATPITLELVSGQRVVDYRTDIHVSGIGPNTKEVPLGLSLPNSANQLLLGVLDGISPTGSKPLKVSSPECEAWLLGDTMFLRTRLTLLSPGWVGKMVSPDGMQAYQLSRTSSILVSRLGEPVEFKIEGF